MELANKKMTAAAKAVRAVSRPFPNGQEPVPDLGLLRVPVFVSFLIRKALNKSDSAVLNVFAASLPFADAALA